jgi:hypothetical protein
MKHGSNGNMGKMKLSILIFASILFSVSSVFASDVQIEPLCEGDGYKAHSQELKKLCDEDQADRADFSHSDQNKLFEMLKRDRTRRTRVVEIFAKGCLKSAEDYLNAATVFQHGEVPDHFYQAFIWARKAFDMGLEIAGQLAGNGIDRYLAKSGRKQLYGGHAEIEPGAANVEDRCFCLWPVEPTFPNSMRKALHFKSKEEIRAWLKEVNKGRKGCSNSYCKVEAKPTPKGSVPGVW